MTQITLHGKIDQNPKFYIPTESSGLAFFSILAESIILKEEENFPISKSYNVIILNKNGVRFCSKHLDLGSQVVLEGEVLTREVLGENDSIVQEAEIIVRHEGQISLFQ